MFGFDIKLVLGAIAGAAIMFVIMGTTGYINGKIKYHQGHTAGWNDAVAETRKVDAAAANKANAARSKVDACFDSGGDWDAAGGVCSGGSTR